MGRSSRRTPRVPLASDGVDCPVQGLAGTRTVHVAAPVDAGAELDAAAVLHTGVDHAGDPVLCARPVHGQLDQVLEPGRPGRMTRPFGQADDVISNYSRNFPAGTSRTEALAALERDDLPPDAKLVASKVGDGCELFLYRSATLGQANSDLGNAVSFDLHSGGDETVYDPHDVAGANSPQCQTWVSADLAHPVTFRPAEASRQAGRTRSRVKGPSNDRKRLAGGEAVVDDVEGEGR